MNFRREALIALVLIVSLVVGAHSTNFDHELSRTKRGVITSFFGNATQKISEALQATAQQEMESIKSLGTALTHTVKDVAIATIDYTQAGIEYYTIPAKVISNILNKNESTSISDAVADPVKNYINSVGRAFNSTVNVYRDFNEATRKAAKVSFDITFAFPKFGLNLLGDKGKEIRKALQESYQTYEHLLAQTAEDYKVLAKQFTSSGLTMFKKFANATVVPKLTKVLQSVTNGTLSQKFELLSRKTIQTRNYGLQVARNLTRGGIFFNKAAYDLEALLRKYSMNLITEEDARNYAQILNEHIKATRDSLMGAQESLETAFKGIIQLFKNAGVHKNELLLALEYVKKNIKESDPEALEMAKNIVKDAFKSIGQELREFGGIIGKAGSDFVKTGFRVARAIPKFGLAVLKMQVEVLGKKFVEYVGKIERAVLAIVQRFTSAGQKISYDGEEVEKTVTQPESDFDENLFDRYNDELDEILASMNVSDTTVYPDEDTL